MYWCIYAGGERERVREIVRERQTDRERHRERKIFRIDGLNFLKKPRIKLTLKPKILVISIQSYTSNH